MASSSYAPTVQPLLATLDASESIPDNSGLAGAQPITVAEVTAYMTGLATFLATYATGPQIAADNAIGGI
jgi:hypothetical protein